MAKDRDPLADITADDSQGLLTNILAEEHEGGWQMVWRLGSWAAGAIGALVAAFLAVHTSTGWQRDQFAAADIARQSQQLQSIARESQAEARRLASAITTLSSDRDRLYARVTVLEQGLDSVTGSVARQAPPASLVLSSATQAVSAPPMITAPAAVAASEPTLPNTPPAAEAAVTAPPQGPEHPAHPHTAAAKELLPASTIYAPPDPGAPKLVVEAPLPTPAPARGAAAAMPAEPTALEKTAPKVAETAAPQADKARPVAIAALPEIRPAETASPHAEVAVQRTEFGVDLGGANSIDGLRALWQGLAATKGSPVAALRPVIAIKERRNGLGLQLRLVAGPLSDAAAAARICASLADGNRPCETTVFDGQRLAMKSADEPPAAPVIRPRRRTVAAAAHPVRRDDAPPPPPPAVAPPAPAAPAASPMSGLFRSH
ncbi:hypothetical protein [Bradyrhizobium sp. 2TAF24]|uniref:hypothetical protein n=1 Tax=Bradyrhizobium sp. 2TAF24 TaxID=3233011 RepID=UPI003F935B14